MAQRDKLTGDSMTESAQLGQFSERSITSFVTELTILWKHNCFQNNHVPENMMFQKIQASSAGTQYLNGFCFNHKFKNF